MSVVTEASATISAQNTFATLSYVPPGARVSFHFSGVNGHTVVLEALWNQAGNWERQKTYTANPTEGEHFDAPRACSLRLGVPTGGFGSGNVPVRLGFDYPIRKQ